MRDQSRKHFSVGQFCVRNDGRPSNRSAQGRVKFWEVLRRERLSVAKTGVLGCFSVCFGQAVAAWLERRSLFGSVSFREV